MRRTFRIAAVLLFLTSPAIAAEPKTNTLTEKEIADGWLLLFDGESTFGWKVEDFDKEKATLAVEKGTLVFTGQLSRLNFTTRFRQFEMRGEYRGKGDAMNVNVRADGTVVNQTAGAPLPQSDVWRPFQADVLPKRFVCVVDGKMPNSPSDLIEPDSMYAEVRFLHTASNVANPRLELRNLKVRPLDTKPLFDGKTLDGWKVNAADPKRNASKFEVTDKGELRVTNGPGDLHTEKAFADFVLQFECKTNGDALNSGIFFRCIPEQYQNGYEAQIQNAFKDGDRTKPADFGTGAIYRRVPARKVVSNDKEWFAMTVIAHGAHISTWVNGFQVVDWTDDRKPDDNPRKGLRTAAGHLSIQGHDPTTEILFRNIRIAEMKAAK